MRQKHHRNSPLHVGVVGATGMVGESFLEILESRKFPVAHLKLFASDRSQGQKMKACGRQWLVEALAKNCFDDLDLVFFSSGDDISKEWAPQAVASGAFAIDNSAAFRMNPSFPLVVPEVNSPLLPTKKNPTIIANPNCSTIQLVVVLNAMKKWGLKEVRVATYQAVSGAGRSAQEELLTQTAEWLKHKKIKTPPKNFAHEIAFNCLPHIGSFNADGFSSEEVKIMNETRKILEMPKLRVSAFAVRVPVLNAHSEAVWVTLDKKIEAAELLDTLKKADGIKLIPHSQPPEYPTAKMAASQNPVYVGRIHRDLNDSNTWLMWIVADNILKGAALNGIQIAERIFDISPHT